MHRSRLDALAVASIAFLAANLLHTLDHFRQGIARESGEILGGGTLLTVLAIALLFFTIPRDPRAPGLATVIGFVSAIAIAAAHLAPYWGVFSDPYSEAHVDAASWLIVFVEIGAALALGLAGLRDLRASDRRAPAA